VAGDTHCHVCDEKEREKRKPEQYLTPANRHCHSSMTNLEDVKLNKHWALYCCWLMRFSMTVFGEKQRRLALVHAIQKMSPPLWPLQKSVSLSAHIFCSSQWLRSYRISEMESPPRLDAWLCLWFSAGSRAETVEQPCMTRGKMKQETDRLIFSRDDRG